MKKALVLENGTNIRSLVVISPKQAGYETIEAETGEEVLAQLKRNPDIKVALLDIMLPDIDGLKICHHIRTGDNNINIIMLTARTQEMDRVIGLTTGADDYVTRPFSPAELAARIDALYRRTGGGDPVDTGKISQPPFLPNTHSRTLEKNEQRVKLTQVEYSVIRLSMDNPGEALSWKEALDSVWGRDYFGELRIVDVNIRRLCTKIEDDPTNPIYITTVWGYGYKWGFQPKTDGASSMGPVLGRGDAEHRTSVSAEGEGLSPGNSFTPGRGRRGAPTKLYFMGYDDSTDPTCITTARGYGCERGF